MFFDIKDTVLGKKSRPKKEPDDVPPSATGSDEPPIATGSDEPPIATGSDEPPSATGSDEPPSARAKQENDAEQETDEENDEPPSANAKQETNEEDDDPPSAEGPPSADSDIKEGEDTTSSKQMRPKYTPDEKMAAFRQFIYDKGHITSPTEPVEHLTINGQFIKDINDADRTDELKSTSKEVFATIIGTFAQKYIKPVE